jgi:8-oxo-dGTP pyrophosphatase MutT (NUDIX family)
MEDQLLCVAQKALLQKNGQILILFKDSGEWSLPGGKIQEGEHDFPAALKREVYEETELSIKIGNPVWTYQAVMKSGPHKGKNLYLIVFDCLYDSGSVKLSHEHATFRWVDKQSYTELPKKNTPLYACLETFFQDTK